MVGTFTDLANIINNAEDGNTITLENDYQYDPATDSDYQSGIMIGQITQLTIDGNGHTIDGSNTSRAFVIDEENTIIKNINFINTSASESGDLRSGGAIYVGESNCSIIDCNFTNCSTNLYSGGAIYVKKPDCSIIDCNFTNCFNDSSGGAIYWENDNGSVSGCSFVGCSASGDGGAIYWGDDNSVVSGCSFVNCSASRSGGAIYCRGYDSTVSDCSFVNCSGEYGGAIRWNASNGNVNNCTFTNCSVTSDGGAIYWYGANSSVNDCLFETDTDTVYGITPKHTKKLIVNLIDTIYPVGSIYTSFNNINPSILFTGTSWEKIEDMFLLGSSSTYTSRSTGGEATHTLSVSEMPTHTHIQNAHTHTQNAHNHGLNRNFSDGSGTVSAYTMTSNRKTSTKYTTSTTATNQNTTATNQNTGGGGSHNNMPPYLVVNIWKRIE